MEPDVILDLFVQNDRLNEDARAEVLRELQSEADLTADHVFRELAERPSFRDKKKVLRDFSELYGIEFLDLEEFEVQPELIDLMDSSTVRQYFVFPVQRTAGNVKLAVAEPPNVRTSDDLGVLLETGVEFCLVDAQKLRDLVDEYYGMSLDEVTDMLEEVQTDESLDAERIDQDDVDASRLEEQAEEASIIRLVNMIILEAVERGASDIHIEPHEDRLAVRYRIDGILHESHEPPKNLQGAVISRIKIMADMNIAERRVPQDGRIKMSVMGKQLDLRVSTLPGIHGESVVLRILDKESISFGLEELGFLPDNKAVFDQLIRRPHGIILVTGPTGSGGVPDRGY